MNLIDREWDISILSFNDPKGIYFNVGNGCINRTDGGYVLLNRIQNHWTSLGRHHPSQKNPIQTVSFVQWIDLDMEYNIVHSHIIDQSTVYEKSLRPVDKMFIIGLEDMRLFKTNIGGWGFIASTGHFGSWDEDRFWGQALGTLTNDQKKIDWIQPLSYKNHRLMEKNWLPFMVNNELRILYETSPMTVLHLRSGGECATDYMGANTGLPVMRGSGSPIPWARRGPIRSSPTTEPARSQSIFATAGFGPRSTTRGWVSEAFAWRRATTSTRSATVARSISSACRIRRQAGRSPRDGPSSSVRVSVPRTSSCRPCPSGGRTIATNG